MTVPTDNQHTYGVLPTFKPRSKTAKLKHTTQFLLLYRAFFITSEFFSPIYAPFIKHIKC